MSPIDPGLTQAVEHALRFSLVCGLGCAAIWGLWLLVAPVSAARFAAWTDRWVSTQETAERLNRPISSHRFFYRHHRIAGGLITAGAAYCLVRWWRNYDREAVLAQLFPRLRSAGLDWLVAAVEWMFVGFNAAILIAGLVVLFRPSLLKTPERIADRWVQVRTDPVLNRRYDPLADLLVERPRIVGVAVLLSCGFLFWRLLTT